MLPRAFGALRSDAFIADLHIHSRYSRACSRDLDLSSLAWWARRKGITLLGTGDFTHPAWQEHLVESLVEAEPGLYRLNPDADAQVLRTLPANTHGELRFMLSVEISTIYKRDGATRKVHHLIYLPDFAAMRRFTTALSRIGNLGSDGRPILGLDSRDLLEITLDAHPDGYLVPAHIWTPWFSALGSKSGFDAIADCYADLAGHIFAVETGLSSDPAMNWRVSCLDGYRLVSNSDAHSAPALGREATVLSCGLSFAGVRDALRTGTGLSGTIEFFPEEGKYHADGHRTCGVRWDPGRTRAAGGRCPECGKPLTVGVLSRVEELADRPVGFRPPGAARVEHLIQLAEILAEIHGVGPRSKAVGSRLADLVAALGPELAILRSVPVEDVGRAADDRLAEAVTRLRAGRVHRTPGYDGEYGVIRLFEPGELAPAGQSETLFEVPQQVDVPQPRPAKAPARARVAAARPVRTRAAEHPAPPPPIAPAPSPHEPFEPMLAGMEEVGTGLLDRLDAMQRVAASAPGGPLLIVAGPGTGKTRTLTHRIAYLCAELGVPPRECLAITFTRRAAEELRQRLDALLGERAAEVTVGTFHAVGLTILRENAAAAGLSERFRVAEEPERIEALLEAGATSEREARRLLGARLDDEAAARYAKALRARDRVDLDDLIRLPVALLEADESLVRRYRSRWRWLFVDEYQDVDDTQYRLLRLLCPDDGNICAIGDPDQSIYAFRGADVAHFLAFARDFAQARVVRLTRNYRSSAPILATATQAIAPATLVPGRRLDPARLDPEAPMVGLCEAASVADEADFVVRTIDELVGGLSHRSMDSGRVDARDVPAGALGFSDIAVLYRTDAQAAPIMDALGRAGIPAQKRSHDRLRDRAGVEAIVRELRYAAGLGGAVAARVRLATQVLADRLAEPTLDAADGTLVAADVRTAAELLTPLAARCGDDLERFLVEVETGAEVDALDPRAHAVTLLTMHAAKGLEYPVVFLIGVEDGLLPLRPAGPVRLDDAALAEERRLFFVGITRAQDRLLLSYARRRYRHGAERDAVASPFLKAIDPGLFERRGGDTPRRPRDRQLRLI